MNGPDYFYLQSFAVSFLGGCLFEMVIKGHREETLRVPYLKTHVFLDFFTRGGFDRKPTCFASTNTYIKLINIPNPQMTMGTFSRLVGHIVVLRSGFPQWLSHVKGLLINPNII